MPVLYASSGFNLIKQISIFYSLSEASEFDLTLLERFCMGWDNYIICLNKECPWGIHKLIASLSCPISMAGVSASYSLILDHTCNNPIML